MLEEVSMATSPTEFEDRDPAGELPQPRADEAPPPDGPDAADPGQHAVDASVSESSLSVDGPTKPTDLNRAAWWAVLKRTVTQMGADKVTTWAAALTYYGVLSLFPGLVVAVAVLRLTGRDTTRRILGNISALAPGPAKSILTTALTDLQNGQSATAGVLAIAGLLGALWSATGYVGAFMQAANSIWDVPEGRPAWKTLPIRLALTIAAGLTVGAAALAVVFTGSLARRVGGLFGVGAGAVQVWDVVKWPVIAVVIGLLFALLYWAAPNARQGGIRWISPGTFLAVAVWIIASLGFVLYASNFGSYNKTYGSLAAVIVFLVWLWISNLALLLGAEFDAELQRGRAIEAGRDPHDEPYVPLRDHRHLKAEGSSDL
jgi:membrane protein